MPLMRVADWYGLLVGTASKGDSEYEGWCWPGSVSYLDFLRPEVQNLPMSSPTPAYIFSHFLYPRRHNLSFSFPSASTAYHSVVCSCLFLSRRCVPSGRAVFRSINT